MATAGGPDIERDGLVFGYDTGYGVADNFTTTRFYTGEPTTNLVPSGQSTGTSVFQRQGYHVEVFTYSQITDYRGRPNVHKLYINPTTTNPYADFGGQYYKSGGSVVGDVYTISFDYYTTKGTGTPGMVVVYANGYKTPTSSGAASLSSATVIDLENGWKRKTQTATITTAGNSWFRLGLNSNSVETEVYIDNFQVELNSHATPFSDGTRSSTQSLIDLTKTTNIDVSNVSFDSTGQPTFDGTDDYIQISLTGADLDSGCTIEGVLKRNSTPSAWRTFFNIKPSGANTPFFEFRSNASNQHIYADYYNGTDYSTNAASLTTGDYGHAIATYDGNGNLKMYFNGELIHTKTGVPSFALGTSPRLTIGRAYSNDRYTDIEAPVVKVYDRALSADEVQQNYNAYKNRFNL